MGIERIEYVVFLKTGKQSNDIIKSLEKFAKCKKEKQSIKVEYVSGILYMVVIYRDKEFGRDMKKFIKEIKKLESFS